MSNPEVLTITTTVTTTIDLNDPTPKHEVHVDAEEVPGEYEDVVAAIVASGLIATGERLRGGSYDSV